MIEAFFLTNSWDLNMYNQFPSVWTCNERIPHILQNSWTGASPSDAVYFEMYIVQPFKFLLQ